LTGLRFVAAYCVVIHHIINNTGVLPPSALPLGNGAVSFFFVLSGFILTHVYARRLQQWSDVKRFWVTRWARIWPLHLVCLLIAIVVYYSPQVVINRIGEFGPKLLANVALLQSWVPNYHWGFSFNGVSWSISDEMFFYAVFPLFLLLGARRFGFAYLGVLAAMVLALAAIRSLSQDPRWPPSVDVTAIVHLNPAMRLLEFLTGMAVGRWFVAGPWPRRAWNAVTSTILEVLVIGLLAAAWYFLLNYRSLHAVSRSWAGPVVSSALVFSGYTPFFAAIIFVFASSRGLLARFFSNRLLVYLGEISFSLYMIHAIVIHLLNSYFRTAMATSPLAAVISVSLLSISASIILFHLVETPAKSALLKWYDRKWRAGLGIVRREWTGFARSPQFAVAVLPAIVCTALLYETNRIARTKPVDPPAANHVAKFGDEATLLAYQCRDENGDAHLQFVWQAGTNRQRRLFIHICDAQGKRLRHAQLANDRSSVTDVIGAVYVQRVTIPAADLAAAHSLGVGFFDAKLGSVPVQASAQPQGQAERSRLRIPLPNSIVARAQQAVR
jgi:peptidoglycan/LPS O-acetylase OafA/YrhL